MRAYQRACLYDLKWQKLRVSMLGTWTTPENVFANLVVLDNYYNSPETPGDGKYERVERITNYLAAIMLGYGNKPEWQKQRAACKNQHEWYTKLKPSLTPTFITGWDWDRVKQDLDAETDIIVLHNIRRDLIKRVHIAIWKVGTTLYRPELLYFIGLLNERLGRSSQL